MSHIIKHIAHRIGQIYGTNRRLFIFYLLLFTAVLWRGFDLGYMGDESGYVTLNTEELARHPWLPVIMQGVDTGHPMLYAYPVAVAWRYFGQINAVANVSIWIWATVALLAVHRLMQLVALSSKHKAQSAGMGAVGMMAAVALFCTPLFLSLVAQYLDPIPYLALLLCMLVAWATGRRRTLGVLAAAATLVRITACLSVLGLGLYDLGYSWFVLRRRTWRDALRALAPFMFSAGVFFLFLFVKLVVLGRPMSTITWNKFEVGTTDRMSLNIKWILDGMLSLPCYSFKPMLGFALAGIVAGWWIRNKEKRSGVPPSGGIPAEAGAPEPKPDAWRPGAAAIYGACFASMAIPTFFYIIYPYYPHARYLLAWHAFFVIAGVHGLYTLCGRRAWLALLLLAPWCGLQVARWHSHWATRAFAALPYRLRMELKIHPGCCLDVLDRKELAHKAARWVRRNRPPDHKIIICLYPTSTIFGTRAAGFLKEPYNIYQMGVVARAGDPDKLFREVLGTYAPFYVVQAVWDSQVERHVLEGLMKKYPFRPVLKLDNPSGEWVRVFCCDSAEPLAQVKTDLK